MSAIITGPFLLDEDRRLNPECKIVYNACFGGVGLSKEAKTLLMERHPELKEEVDGEAYLDFRALDRTDPRLVEIVELLGKKANSRCADLKVTKPCSPNTWKISNYDGAETVVADHGVLGKRILEAAFVAESGGSTVDWRSVAMTVLQLLTEKKYVAN